MNQLIVPILCFVGFLLGVAVGRFSLKRELNYLRNFQKNRERLENIDKNLKGMGL